MVWKKVFQINNKKNVLVLVMIKMIKTHWLEVECWEVVLKKAWISSNWMNQLQIYTIRKSMIR